MSEDTKTATQSHDAAKAEEKRRRPEPVQGTLSTCAGETLLLDRVREPAKAVTPPRRADYRQAVDLPRSTETT